MIREAFLRVLNEHPTASKEPIKDHLLAGFIRNRFPELFTALLPSVDRFIVKSSAGQGNWTTVPWIATFDILITTTAQNGYYPTFLFKSDMSGVYFNLNQGVTDIQNRYKARAKEVLEIRAKDFLAQIGEAPAGYQSGTIDLGNELAASVKLYENGSIIHKFYAKDDFPSDEQIVKDYKEMLEIYGELVDNDNSIQTDESEYEGTFFEDTRLRIKHERIERDSRIPKAVKKVKGHVCEVCSFDFQKVYGEIGEGYIEAHHLIPLSKQKNQIIPLDPKKDFAVLCANCHRMAHRLKDPSEIGALIKLVCPERKT